ncbi:MAG TPA: nucleotidyl transferase AbiEii/AbiGii toxin family protein [Syntrophobacteria bacterium]|nr:nucleotidyl transferase AbiEii/AbiGii toxin family protein [Syntrophobacteria bacterium]
MERSIKEDTSCYASSAQRELLGHIGDIEVIAREFFITGGTTLSVFYLHHRTSDDLDFFSLEFSDLRSIDIILKRIFKRDLTLIQSSQEFLSYFINNVKVDFVFDPLSSHGKRARHQISSGQRIQIDTIENIASNKLSAITSRYEPKDLVDFYFISEIVWKGTEKENFLKCYDEARKKEALLDDPAMAAYQFEQLLGRVLAEKEDALPTMKKKIDWSLLERLCRNFIDVMYRMQKWS